MSEKENIAAAQAIFHAWNDGDLSKADSYSADEFQAEGSGAGSPMTAEQNRVYLQNFMTAFPGSKFEILRTIACDDYVVTHWKVSGGSHTGPLMTPSGTAIPPTGKSAVVMGSTTSQLKHGKIIRSWTFWDMASLLVQLGLLPVM